MPHPYEFTGTEEQAAQWRSGYANLYTACPRCGANPRFVCETPSGRKSKYPHTERMKAVPQDVGVVRTG